MLAILQVLGTVGANRFKSRRRLEAENLFLRHQLNIALRRRPPSLRLRGSDRALLVWMTRLWPSLLGLAQVVQPAPSCGGIGRVSGPTGDGSREVGPEDRESNRNCANSSDG
jgi:hypothetical protein